MELDELTEGLVTQTCARPKEFIDGLSSADGEAGHVVFDYMLIREIKREFPLGELPIELASQI